MKSKIILATITIVVLFSTFVYAETETTINPGDNPGQTIVNPWIHLFTTTPTTTQEETTTEETTTAEPTTEAPTIPTTVDIKVDGVSVGTVSQGGSFTLPAVAQYGYLVGDKLYKPGTTVEDITSDTGTISIDSIDSINISTHPGAAIRIDGPAGIRFVTRITSVQRCDGQEIKTKLNNTEAFDCYTLIITEDDYWDTLDENFTLESIESHGLSYYLKVKNSGWLSGNVGDFSAGILNVKTENWNRNFTARGFLELKYENGETQKEYATYTEFSRSIAYVAVQIKNTPEEYNHLTDDEKARVDTYASYYN